MCYIQEQSNPLIQPLQLKVSLHQSLQTRRENKDNFRNWVSTFKTKTHLNQLSDLFII